MTTISLENAKEPKKPKLRKPENLGDTGEEKKAKPKKKEKPAKKEKEPITFPIEGFVNKYHFMRVGPKVLEALGWKINGDRLAVELDLKDGALIVRKPSK
jgi:hypothetical protein